MSGYSVLLLTLAAIALGLLCGWLAKGSDFPSTVHPEWWL